MPGLKRKLETLTEHNKGSGSSSQLRGEKRARLSRQAGQDETSSCSSESGVNEFEATQILQKRRENERRGNQPAENGIVESVTCTNFMCHSFLHVELGPLINFIVGHNGSGKSAVLTALTISLGGKASSTNRAGKLKSFIKEGQEYAKAYYPSYLEQEIDDVRSCTLSVQIKNGGDTGYQTETYGNTITVERTFNRAGASGFKLKSSSGKTVSARKADLDDISDYFAMQLDNPISVLSQDMARSFLNSSSPQEKYKFFIKGVNLDQLHHDYQLLEQNIEKIQAVSEERQADLKQLKARETTAKSLLDLVGKQDAIRSKMTEFGLQMAWSQVEDQEVKLQEIQRSIRQAGSDLEHARDDARRAEDAFDKHNARRDDAQANLLAAQRLKVPIADEKRVAKEARDSLVKEATELQNEQRQISDGIRTSGESIQKARQEIQNELRRLEESHGGGHDRKLAEFQAKKIEVDEATRALESNTDAGRPLLTQREQAKEQVTRLNLKRQEKEGAVQGSKARLRELRREGPHRSGFPANMGTLLESIGKERGFRERPVGPMGRYVQLNAPVWSKILEKAIGSALNGFIVTSKQDQDRLSSIMQGANCVCPVFIGSHQSFERVLAEPEEKYLTALRALKVENALVLRQLIVQHAIDQIVLIEDMSHARALMNQERLLNVKQCYSIHKADARMGMRFAYGTGNNLQSSFVEGFQGPPRMKTQRLDQIRYEENVLHHLEEDLAGAEAQLEAARRDLAERVNLLESHDRVKKDLKLAVQQAQSSRDIAQDDVDNNVAEDGRLEALKKECLEQEEQKAHCENAWQENRIAKDTTQAGMKSFTDQMREIDHRIAGAQAKIEGFEEDLQRAEDARSDALVAKNQAIEAAESARCSTEDLQGQEVLQAGRVREFEQHAADIGPRVRVDVGESPDSLDKKLEKLEREVKRSEAKLGASKQKIAEDYSTAHRIHTEAWAQYEKERALLKLLKSTHFERTFRWGRFRKHITARARIMFVHLLSERNFRGTLTIDHDSSLLDLHVQPDETQSKRQSRQAKTLSGGEKSFSQICLLLALWEAIGAPIRCLDEFDVFMDTINRDASLRLLTRAARQSAGRQFVLITPQSMASVDREVDVKIIKLRDPERNQSTLDFGRA